MLTRASTLVQIVLLVSAAFRLPGGPHVAADYEMRNRPTDAIQAAVVHPAGIYGADDAMEREILDAIDRFALAGLVLPKLRIYVHESHGPCKGHLGLFAKGGDEQRIDLCERYPDVITHELAHAWEHDHLDDDTRKAFLEWTGLTAWNDKDVPHPARGVERMAYLVSWALEDQQIQAISLGHYADDLDLYEFLTGSPSPRIAHLDAALAPTMPVRTIVAAELPTAVAQTNPV